MLLTLLVSFFAGTAAPAGTADCLDGFWDFGPRKAVLWFQCREKEENRAVIMFCNRDKLIKKGICLSPDAIPCEWDSDKWACTEDKFSATIHRLSPTTIQYKFKSSFNSGDLKGELL